MSKRQKLKTHILKHIGFGFARLKEYQFNVTSIRIRDGVIQVNSAETKRNYEKNIVSPCLTLIIAAPISTAPFLQETEGVNVTNFIDNS